MSRLRISSCVLVVAVGAMLWISSRDVATQSGTPAYGVTDLGGGIVPLAVSPGAFPSIQGSIQEPNGGDHAFSGNVAGGIHDLGTLGGLSSQASGSYFGSAVIGSAQVPSNATHAFVQEGVFPNFSLRDLGTLGGRLSEANGITLVSTGPSTFKYLIVGESGTSAATRAFVYDTSTATMSDLGATLGGTNTSAAAINSNQHVVGWAELPNMPPGAQHAFLFQNGVTVDLGTLGGARSEALAINDSDVVVGRSLLSADAVNHHAFRYQNGVMQDLGTLGGEYSEADGVSPAGTIVGWALTSAGDQHAFVWRDGVMTDLNSLIPPGTGWVLQKATAIGSGTAGQEIIVGWGQFQNQSTFHGFVLTPPIDLSLSVHPPHQNDLDTNIPNPHEAGQLLTVGPTVWNRTSFVATNVTVTDTFNGPVEIVNWSGADSCSRNGQQLTCTFKAIDGAGGGRDLMINVRSTGAGVFTHSATIVSADQPDPNTTNNSDSESNTAVSLLSLVAAASSVQGGQPVLNRATLTSPAPTGGATVRLTSSNPAIASVPSQFDVLRGCCDNGTWREFYVTTQAVSAPVTVQISATYGLVTQTVPLTITPGSTGVLAPYGGSPRPIPGTILSEVFDEGGEGVAYHDTTPGNTGGEFRSTDVDIETSSQGLHDVGWIDAGEWLNYTVNVQSAGDYRVVLYVSSPGGATMHIGFNGPSQGQWKSVPVPATDGWQNWTGVVVPVTLGAGTQQMTLFFDTGGMNFLDASVESISGGTLSPFSGTPAPIPGTIDSEKFDNGGEGVAYHDETIGNAGGQFRNTNVDIEVASEGGYDVGWIDAGEWLNYTVNVTTAGTYTVRLRVASIDGATFHVGFNGPSAGQWKTVSVPPTGGWQTWTTVSVPVTLGAGTQQLTLFFDTGGMNFRQAVVGP